MSIGSGKTMVEFLSPAISRQRLQVAQLHRLRLLRQHLGRLGSFSAACCSPSAWITLARRSRSASAWRAIARTIDSFEVDVLDLDVGDLDAPGVGLRVEDLLDVEVQPLALGQHLVELVLAEHRAQRGLRQLAGGLEEVLDLDDRASRGSTTRKYSTALTLTETLSREITSWLGTSSTTVRRSTRTICWMHRDQQHQARPLDRQKRPSWNTTPRSYSRRMRSDDGEQRPAAGRQHDGRTPMHRIMTWLLVGSSWSSSGRTSASARRRAMTRTRWPGCSGAPLARASARRRRSAQPLAGRRARCTSPCAPSRCARAADDRAPRAPCAAMRADADDDSSARASASAGDQRQRHAEARQRRCRSAAARRTTKAATPPMPEHAEARHEGLGDDERRCRAGSAPGRRS